MKSELDIRFDAAMAEITAPDGPLAIERDEQGRALIVTLPPTLDAFFRHFCTGHGESEMIVCGDERLTYGRADALSERLARVLAGSFAIGKGDRIAIAMANSPAWIVTYMAVLKAGAVATLINGWWQPHELAYGLALSDPKLVIADPERARRIAATECAAPMVTLPTDKPLGEALAPLLDGGVEADLPAIEPEDDATILFTSGSTAGAKGAVSTHRQVTMGAYIYLAVVTTLRRLVTDAGGTFSSTPAALIAVPLFHVTGEVPLMLTSMAVGRKLVMMRKWSAAEALRLIEAERVTYFIGVPTMGMEIAQHPDRLTRDTSTLSEIIAGGAARPPAHVERLREAFPAGNPMMGYGLTETNAVGCTNFSAGYLEKPASTGRPFMPFVELAVLGPDGLRLPSGDAGEIALRSAANISGYWRDPAATAAAFTEDGYVRSGDVGYVDDAGYLFIVDRTKDIIIRGGENISCQEVEAALYAHPAISEASVFGLPDERLGEVPGAVIHTGGAPIDEEELRLFLGERLARFKIPTRFWMTDDPLPKLGTGKIDKRTLRSRYT